VRLFSQDGIGVSDSINFPSDVAAAIIEGKQQPVWELVRLVSEGKSPESETPMPSQIPLTSLQMSPPPSSREDSNQDGNWCVSSPFIHNTFD
jgi:hypothetical protein